MSQREDSSPGSQPKWLHKHVHEPNPEPPSEETAFALALPGGDERTVTVDALVELPQSDVADCFIVSTGHGTSGPFTFGGVRLVDFVRVFAADVPWRTLDVISADGFGNRVLADELAAELAGETVQRPILLAIHVDGERLTRAQGLVRLIVPSETDDALRQVKWIGRIEISD